MSHFTNSLHTEWLDGGNQWRVTETFEFHSGEENSGLFIRCDEGMITDLASIPRALRWLIPKVGKDAQGSVVHDRGYRDGFMLIRSADGTERRVPVSRGMVDSMYYQAMIALGTGRWRRRAIYQGLRSFGWVVWNKYRAGDKVSTETTR